ncbi:hypothetical protein BDW74DRAFT_173694 [Aspergillus multicolor]|uniref:uncharacterized protein n=1 Tax=Aspergillus multicolor TaxID=41759 RepID=UPI003CCCDE20
MTVPELPVLASALPADSSHSSIIISPSSAENEFWFFLPLSTSNLSNPFLSHWSNFDYTHVHLSQPCGLAEVLDTGIAAGQDVSSSTVITSYVLSPVYLTSYASTDGSDDFTTVSSAVTASTYTDTAVLSPSVSIPPGSTPLGSVASVTSVSNPVVSTSFGSSFVVPSSLGTSSVFGSSGTTPVFSSSLGSSPFIPTTSTNVVPGTSTAVIPTSSTSAVSTSSAVEITSTNAVSSSSTAVIPTSSTSVVFTSTALISTSSNSTNVIPSGSFTATSSNTPGLTPTTSTTDTSSSSTNAVSSSGTSTALIPTASSSASPVSPMDSTVTLPTVSPPPVASTGVLPSATPPPGISSHIVVTSTTWVTQTPAAGPPTSSMLVVTVTEEHPTSLTSLISITTTDESGATVIITQPTTVPDLESVTGTTTILSLPDSVVIVSSMDEIFTSFSHIIPIFESWASKPGPPHQTKAIEEIDKIDVKLESFIKHLGGKFPPVCKKSKRGLFDAGLNVAKGIADAAGNAASALLDSLGCITKIITRFKDEIKKGDIENARDLLKQLIDVPPPGPPKPDDEDDDDDDDDDDDEDDDEGDDSIITISGTTTSISCTSEITTVHVAVLCEPTSITFADSTVSTTTCSPSTTLTTTGCSVTDTTTTITNTCVEETADRVTVLCEPISTVLGDSTISTTTYYPTTTITATGCSVTDTTTTVTSTPTSGALCSHETCGDPCSDQEGAWVTLAPIDCANIPVSVATALPSGRQDLVKRDQATPTPAPPSSIDAKTPFEVQGDLVNLNKQLTEKNAWQDYGKKGTYGRWFSFPRELSTRGIKGLTGCTSVMIVSDQGVYISHIWESPVFVFKDNGLPTPTAPDYFEKHSYMALVNGGPDFPSVEPLLGLVGSDAKPGPLHVTRNPRVFVITPYGEETGSEYMYSEKAQKLKDAITTFLWHNSPNAKGEITGYRRSNRQVSTDDLETTSKAVREVSKIAQWTKVGNQYNAMGRYRLPVVVQTSLPVRRRENDLVKRQDDSSDDEPSDEGDAPDEDALWAPVDVNTATCSEWFPFAPYGRALSRMAAGMQALNGCTAVFIVSVKGVYIAHIWEDPVFASMATRQLTDDATFFRQSLSALLHASPEFPEVQIPISNLIWEKPGVPRVLHPSNTPKVYVITPFNDAILGGNQEPQVLYTARTTWLAEELTTFMYQNIGGVPEGLEGEVHGYVRSGALRWQLLSNDNHFGKVVLDVAPYHRAPAAHMEFYAKLNAHLPAPGQAQRRDVAPEDDDICLVATRPNVTYSSITPRYPPFTPSSTPSSTPSVSLPVTSSTTPSSTPSTTSPSTPSTTSSSTRSTTSFTTPSPTPSPTPTTTSSTTSSSTSTTSSTTSADVGVNPPGQPSGFSLPPSPQVTGGTLPPNLTQVSEPRCFELPIYVAPKVDPNKVEEVAEYCRDGRGVVNRETVLGENDPPLQYTLASGTGENESPYYVVKFEWEKDCKGPPQNVHHPMTGHNCHQTIIKVFSMDTCKTDNGYGGSIRVGCVRYSAWLKGEASKGGDDSNSESTPPPKEDEVGETIPYDKSLSSKTTKSNDYNPIHILNEDLADKLADMCENGGIGKDDMSIGPGDVLVYTATMDNDSTEYYKTKIQWKAGCEGPNQSPINPMKDLSCKDITKMNLDKDLLDPGSYVTGGSTLAGCLVYTSSMAGYPMGEIKD